VSTFALDISRICNKFGINAHTVARKIILDIQRETMQATPVLNGFLRSNWFVGITTPPNTVNPKLSDGGASARNQAAGTLNGFKWGQTIYLTNNLPYANRIEFQGWSHTKAPSGMLRVTVARYQAQFGRWS
jgi:hypothetical protein